MVQVRMTAEGRLIELKALSLDNLPELQGTQNVHNWALIKDHLFVFQRKEEIHHFGVSRPESCTILDKTERS